MGQARSGNLSGKSHCGAFSTCHPPYNFPILSSYHNLAMSVGARSYRALDRPSKATLRAAKAAAASPHGLINLVRLVQGLEVAAQEDDGEDAQALQRLRKDAEVCEVLCGILTR